MQKHSRLIVVFPLFSVLLLGCSEKPPQTNKSSAKSHSQYIINCQSDCAAVEKNIRESGGRITGRYSNFDLLAFQIDPTSENNLRALAQYRLVKDKVIANPAPYEQKNLHLSANNRVDTMSLQSLPLKPKNYVFKNVQNGAAKLHEQNLLGDGVVVAIIDSGTANNAEIVPTLEGNVIGGENFVPDDNEPSATSTLNDEHGTWVAAMIAAHASVTIESTHELAQAVSAYAPDNVLPVDETQVEIPLVGAAPAAQIYALKTFGVNSPGAPSSRIISAMDRVLTLKQNFNAGIPSEPIAGDGSEDNPFIYDSLDIKVLNLSLGGPALFPGGEIEDIITDALLQAGVVVVTSAGNEGFAAITGGSPGTAFNALTIGAASDPVHERILRELQLGPGKGGLFRPLDDLVVSSFSSRGPTADGRVGVDLVANGVATFVQGADGHISIVSGTSFSSPTVAGVAALLWQAFPDKSATEIRNALILGANPELMQNTAGIHDQGNGFLDAAASFTLLAEDKVEPQGPGLPIGDINSQVSTTLSQMEFDILAADESQASRWFILDPGQVKQLFIETNSQTQALDLNIEHIIPLSAEQNQNQLNGDNIIVNMIDAPLSFDHSLIRDILDVPQIFSFQQPQSGLLRLAIMGNWTNRGKVLVTLEVNKTIGSNLNPVATGTIADGEVFDFLFALTEATTAFNVALRWNGSWAQYPTHDLDIIVVDPEGNLHFDGATLNSPEMAFFDSPLAGNWTVIVDGFLLHDFSDEFSLYVSDQNNSSLEPIN